MYTFDFLLTHPSMKIPAFWGRQVKLQPSQTAMSSLDSSAPWSRDAGDSVSRDGLREQHVERRVSASRSSVPGAGKLGWDMALGSGQRGFRFI